MKPRTKCSDLPSHTNTISRKAANRKHECQDLKHASIHSLLWGLLTLDVHSICQGRHETPNTSPGYQHKRPIITGSYDCPTPLPAPEMGLPPPLWRLIYPARVTVGAIFTRFVLIIQWLIGSLLYPGGAGHETTKGRPSVACAWQQPDPPSDRSRV